MLTGAFWEKRNSYPLLGGTRGINAQRESFTKKEGGLEGVGGPGIRKSLCQPQQKVLRDLGARGRPQNIGKGNNLFRKNIFCESLRNYAVCRGEMGGTTRRKRLMSSFIDSPSRRGRRSSYRQNAISGKSQYLSVEGPYQGGEPRRDSKKKRVQEKEV